MIFRLLHVFVSKMNEICVSITSWKPDDTQTKTTHREKISLINKKRKERRKEDREERVREKNVRNF